MEHRQHIYDDVTDHPWCLQYRRHVEGAGIESWNLALAFTTSVQSKSRRVGMTLQGAINSNRQSIERRRLVNFEWCGGSCGPMLSFVIRWWLELVWQWLGWVINVCDMLRWYLLSVASAVPGNTSPHNEGCEPSDALSPHYSQRWKVPQVNPVQEHQYEAG